MTSGGSAFALLSPQFRNRIVQIKSRKSEMKYEKKHIKNVHKNISHRALICQNYNRKKYEISNETCKNVHKNISHL